MQCIDNKHYYTVQYLYMLYSVTLLPIKHCFTADKVLLYYR